LLAVICLLRVAAYLLLMVVGDAHALLVLVTRALSPAGWA